jgi:hypothetical protein
MLLTRIFIVISVILMIAGCGGGGGGGGAAGDSSTVVSGGGSNPAPVQPAKQNVTLNFSQLFAGAKVTRNSSRTATSLLPGLATIRLVIKVVGSTTPVFDQTFQGTEESATVNLLIGNKYEITVTAIDVAGKAFASGTGQADLVQKPTTSEPLKVYIPVKPTTPLLISSNVNPASGALLEDITAYFHVLAEDGSVLPGKVQISVNGGEFSAYPKCDVAGWPACSNPPAHYDSCDANTQECFIKSVRSSERTTQNGFPFSVSSSMGSSVTIRFAAVDADGGLEQMKNVLYTYTSLAQLQLNPTGPMVRTTTVMTGGDYGAVQLVPVAGVFQMPDTSNQE